MDKNQPPPYTPHPGPPPPGFVPPPHPQQGPQGKNFLEYLLARMSTLLENDKNIDTVCE